MEPLWRVYLFDGPRLLGLGGSEVRRFRSQRVAAFLAYLALRLGKDVSREELAEALWPEEDPKVTANRLRVSLTSLRHQLEPAGVSPGSVLDASRSGYLRLRRESVWCDVDAFESSLKRGDLLEASGLATGQLLPGFFDEWILAERERLEALKEDLPTAERATPDAAPSVHEVPRRLPLYLTSFVGRERERDEIANLLQSDSPARLVTIVGLGGNGKTRLSVEVARALPEGWSVWFVPLANLWQGEQLAQTIRASLELPAQPDALSQLVEFLAQHERPLLVLDNLEQIALRAGPFLAELLARAPHLRLLATSRRRLEVSGEVELAIAPLPPPDESESDALASLALNPAVRLFVDRAGGVRPDFALTAANRDAVAGICRLLEGIPLGIELAAVRAASIAPAQLYERLKSHWDSLENDDRREKREDRHRSLRAVIEWSVALLPPDARRLFVQVAYFSGGATLAAVEEVCQTPFALDTLTRLRSSSLLLLTEQAGEVRFSMLEVLRQWAVEQLPPPERDALADRHAAWFRRLALDALPFVELREERLWADRLDVDRANLRQALASLQQADPPDFVAMLESLGWYWETRGAAEGREYVLAALPIAESPEARARLEVILCALHTFLGEPSLAVDATDRALETSMDSRTRCRMLFQRAFALFRLGRLEPALEAIEGAIALADDPILQTRTLATKGAILRDLSRFDEARAAMEESVALGKAHNLGRALGGTLNNLAALLYILNQDGADERFAEAMDLYAELGLPSGVAVILMNRAVMASRRGDFEEGEGYLREAIALLRRVGQRRHLASASSTLGQVLTTLGRLDEARESFAEALRLRLELGNPHSLFVTLGALSSYFLKRGEPERAARFLGFSQAYLDAFGHPLPPDEVEERDGQVRDVREALPSAAFDPLFEGARALDPDLRQKEIQAFLTS